MWVVQELVNCLFYLREVSACLWPCWRRGIPWRSWCRRRAPPRQQIPSPQVLCLKKYKLVGKALSERDCCGSDLWILRWASMRESQGSSTTSWRSWVRVTWRFLWNPEVASPELNLKWVGKFCFLLAGGWFYSRSYLTGSQQIKGTFSVFLKSWSIKKTYPNYLLKIQK